eukprot:761425-Hanusia_phi.AAC.3
MMPCWGCIGPESKRRPASKLLVDDSCSVRSSMAIALEFTLLSSCGFAVPSKKIAMRFAPAMKCTGSLQAAHLPSREYLEGLLLLTS